MRIEKASMTSFDQIRQFYHSLIDTMKEYGLRITWEKDVNPSPEFLKKSIEDGCFYTGYHEDQMAAGMIVNHDHNPEYQAVPWKIQAEDKEILVIHCLGVHPYFSGKGAGREMVDHAISMARDQKMKAVRLDVLKENTAARNLYIRYGFEYRTTLKLYYPNTGRADFEMYEYILE